MTFDSIVKTFEKIKSEWNEDSRVDHEFRDKQYSTDLGALALEIPFAHNKYLNYYLDFQQIKKSLDIQLRKLTKEKRQYYDGSAEKPFPLSIKTAEKMKVFMEADEDIINLQSKIGYVEDVIFFLDQVMKQISNRGYQIKSAIEWEKFINGEN